MPNNDGMNGGASSQFNQDAILEFQVLTAGYKAEFGHGSGGVINVISKSGTNDWHGLASAFYRNSHLDSSNSDLVNNGAVPFLQRWDPTFQFGGPIKKDKVFMFGVGGANYGGPALELAISSGYTGNHRANRIPIQLQYPGQRNQGTRSPR